MTKWKDVKKGDRVLVGGGEWTVTKIKAKGKTVKVTVASSRGTFSHEVKAKDAVELVPLHDARRAQSRWATKREAAAGPERKKVEPVLKAGDPSIVKPPTKASGDLWDTPADKVEKRVGKLLGAVLVAQSNNEAEGYYVPPVDVSTVAAHMMLFHGGSEYAEHDESRLMAMHEEQHRMIREGDARPKVNHWHTKVRP